MILNDLVINQFILCFCTIYNWSFRLPYCWLTHNLQIFLKAKLNMENPQGELKMNSHIFPLDIIVEWSKQQPESSLVSWLIWNEAVFSLCRLVYSCPLSRLCMPSQAPLIHHQLSIPSEWKWQRSSPHHSAYWCSQRKKAGRVRANVREGKTGP